MPYLINLINNVYVRLAFNYLIIIYQRETIINDYSNRSPNEVAEIKSVLLT